MASPFSGEGLVRHVFHQRDGRVFILGIFAFIGHDLRIDAEERRLQNGGGLAAQSEFACDLDRIDDVELRVLFRKNILHFRGKLFFEGFDARPFAVEQKRAAFLEVGGHVVTGHVGRVMAGDKVSRVDEIFRLNGLVPESQMGNGDAARFFGIVEEIRLHVFVGMVADNLDGVLVGAHRTVGAETVELAGSGACGAASNFSEKSREVLVTSS